MCSAEALAGLTALQDVTLEATDITTAEVFEGSGIQSLNVRSTWITVFSPLESCPGLSRLIVGELPSGAAETLAGLTNLAELRLYATPGLTCPILQDFKSCEIWICMAAQSLTRKHSRSCRICVM